MVTFKHHQHSNPLERPQTWTVMPKGLTIKRRTRRRQLGRSIRWNCYIHIKNKLEQQRSDCFDAPKVVELLNTYGLPRKNSQICRALFTIACLSEKA